MQDLQERIRRLEARWGTLTDAERAEVKRAWEAAGWVTCGHDACPPWDCRA